MRTLYVQLQPDIAPAIDEAGLRDLLRVSTIVACEGSKGWDNYRLLHHFDPEVALDGQADL